MRANGSKLIVECPLEIVLDVLCDDIEVSPGLLGFGPDVFHNRLELYINVLEPDINLLLEVFQVAFRGRCIVIGRARHVRGV